MKQLLDRLDDSEREAMFQKRKRYELDLSGTATILNCRQNHISDAQIGREIPLEVYNAIKRWIDSF